MRRTKRSVRCQVDILAAPEHVWAVLTDFPAYPQWNPSVMLIEGRLRTGERLRIRARLAARLTLTLRVKLVICDPLLKLCWEASVVRPAIFLGRHCFVIEPLPGRGVRLVQEETFTGALAPLFAFSFAGALRSSYNDCNQAIKKRAEELADVLVAKGAS
jgi:hypothetical protein